MGPEWIWQPLVCHGLDVAACADAALARAAESERHSLAALLGLDWPQARPWLLLVMACHDIGKACPGFQSRWRNLTGIDRGRNPDIEVDPALVGQIALRALLPERGWEAGIAAAVADAVVCHRGMPAPDLMLRAMQDDERRVGGEGWAQARRRLFEVCAGIFLPSTPPAECRLDAVAMDLLSRTTHRADEMASDEARFPFDDAADFHGFRGWYQRSLRRAEALFDGSEQGAG